MDYWTIESLGLKVGNWIEWGSTANEVIQEDGTKEVDVPPHTKGQVIAIREGSPPKRPYSDTVDTAVLSWAQVKFENGTTMSVDVLMDWEAEV